MRRLPLLLLLLATLLTPRLQADEVGTWTYHLAYHDATQVAPAADAVYALFGGNLLVYSTADTEVRTVTKMDGLSGKNASLMAYCRAERCLVLVYADCNVDLLYEGGSVVNMPQLAAANTGDMKPTALTINGSQAVLSTGEGVALINVARVEVSGYYRPAASLGPAALLGGRLVVATARGLLSCDTGGNPSDASRWTLARSLSAQPTAFTPFAGGLYFVVPTGSDAGLWWATAAADGTLEAQRVDSRVYTQGYADAAEALFFNAQRVATFAPDAPTTPAAAWEQTNAWRSLARTTAGDYWACEPDAGLVAYRLADAGLAPTGQAVGGFGPRRDLCYRMHYAGQRLLVAGGRLDPFDRVHYPATLMAYEDGRWTTFQEDGVPEATGLRFRDMTSLVQDPADPAHHFAAAAGTGLYEYRDYQFVANYNSRNSALVTVALDGVNPNYVRVDGLNYDTQGNLWMVNNGADTLIRVLRADGSWQGVYVSAVSTAPTCERALFDQQGRFWVASRRSVSGHAAGLLCLDWNGTLANTSDDVATYRTSAYNEDGDNCSLEGIMALTLDPSDGSLWLGTSAGLFVVARPDEWSSSSFRLTQIKVPRGDGTNNADYLLAGVPVTDIAVDGARRKWIGTEANGLYLVSPDGTEVLAHFEAATSPLLSDSIHSLAPNPLTGQIMIGTSAGICAYQSEATEPAAALVRSDVRVFPNPVRPEHHSLRVAGLTDGAEVRIADASGRVVTVGNAVGGTFTWDCRSRSGRRVATGVYYVMVATADGSKAVVAKVVII